LQAPSEVAFTTALAKLRDQGAPYIFLATKPAEPITPVTAVHQAVLDAATEALIRTDNDLTQAQALTMGLAFKWGLQGGGRGAASRRKATLAIMEGLASSDKFWQFAGRPELQYDVGRKWADAVGELKVHFTPRLNELLGLT
jgi:hypothetical protein